MLKIDCSVLTRSVYVCSLCVIILFWVILLFTLFIYKHCIIILLLQAMLTFSAFNIDGLGRKNAQI